MLDQNVELTTADDALAAMLSAIYAPFEQLPAPDSTLQGNAIEIAAIGSASGNSVSYADTTMQCESIAQVIYTIDKIITVALQMRRPDLFFVHAAVVSAGNHAILLVGDPGAGKSTLCWSLCDAGYGYLSDELAPLRLEDMTVQPFPRAISLKSETEDSPVLPATSIDAGVTTHVPADTLRGGYQAQPLPIAAIVFLQPETEVGTPILHELSPADGAARLYANGLNQLAHKDDGLAAAIAVATATRCFSLRRSGLSEMQAAIGGLSP